MEKEAIKRNTDSENADISGFSEKQANLDIELQAGKWHNVKLFKTVKNSKNTMLTREEVLAVYHAVNDRLSNLVTLFCHFSVIDPEKSKAVAVELRKFRMAQDIILNSLVWEKQSEFRKEMIPSEVWEMCAV
jgi:hypothetical protein